MQSQDAPELLVVSATASSEPAAYAHALRQLLGGVLGGIAASGAPHGGLRLAVASGRALTTGSFAAGTSATSGSALSTNFFDASVVRPGGTFANENETIRAGR